MFGRSRIRWLMVLGTAGDAAPQVSLEEIVSKLRRETADPELQHISSGSGSISLVLESSWDGYLLGYKKLKATSQPVHLSGYEVASIEPAFNAEYLKRLKLRQPETLSNLIHVYGPVVKAVVDKYHSKFAKGIGLPPADIFLQEIWSALILKIERVVESYDPSKGTSQKAYIYRTADHLVIDVLRAVRKVKDNEIHVDFQQKPPADADFVGIIDDRVLIAKVREVFYNECMNDNKDKHPTDWELFVLYYVNEIPKTEICARYNMSANLFEVRTMRIRKRLKKIIRRWK